ncbi:hypothetical protein [Acidithiobacillus ferriphilus]|jgi:hypothetical protein|uniref:hypothetical protein n=1 Tax=Acidithiobacillus ferriphilus TaxID=1689834 RepID=UPI00232C7292|nr:hypothetical protein [Acidithiobacillus ferriphilus]WCE94234.1 hypothetical protein PJU76_01435 [Acidithiobacillus ferriphilus]
MAFTMHHDGKVVPQHPIPLLPNQAEYRLLNLALIDNAALFAFPDKYTDGAMYPIIIAAVSA